MPIGYLGLVGAAVIWGTNHVVTRAVSNDVPLVALTFWRWAIAVLFMVPIAWPWLRRDAALLWAHRHAIALAGLNGMGVFGIAISAGPFFTTAANVSLISSTTPIWVIALGALTGIERVTRRQGVGILLAFLGTAHIVLAGRWGALAEIRPALGDLISVAAAMLWAVFSLQMRRLPRGLHPLSLTVCAAVAGLGLLGLVYLAWGLGGHPWLRPATPTMSDASAFALVAYIALGPTFLGNVFFTIGVQRIGAAVAGAILYLTPVVSTVLAITLLGERLQLFHVVGIAGIALGLGLTTMRRPR
ncbi:MAG: DMT family transporter [Alphaproteobacteria bacterium]|nr:DMT family transporter [Alphaproteobacteria bacterium]